MPADLHAMPLCLHLVDWNYKVCSNRVIRNMFNRMLRSMSVHICIYRVAVWSLLFLLIYMFNVKRKCSIQQHISSDLNSSSHRFMLVFHSADMGHVWQYVYTHPPSLHVQIYNSTEFQTNLKYELAAHRPLQTSSLPPYRTQLQLHLQHLPLLISPKSHLKKNRRNWNLFVGIRTFLCK